MSETKGGESGAAQGVVKAGLGCLQTLLQEADHSKWLKLARPFGLLLNYCTDARPKVGDLSVGMLDEVHVDCPHVHIASWVAVVILKHESSRWLFFLCWDGRLDITVFLIRTFLMRALIVHLLLGPPPVTPSQSISKCT